MKKLEQELIEYLIGNPNYPSVAEILKNFKNLGGKQEEAYDVLVQLRHSKDEEFENRVLEIMDIVVGWCSIDQRIWENQLKT